MPRLLANVACGSTCLLFVGVRDGAAPGTELPFFRDCLLSPTATAMEAFMVEKSYF